MTPFSRQARPAAGVVEQEAREPVDRAGEAGLGAGAVLELVPQGSQLGALVGGEQAVQAVGRRLLAGVLRRPPGVVVDVGVARVDLDDVVDHDHAHHGGDVDGLGGVLGQHERHQREGPRVLGRVLAARAVGHVAAPDHGLEPVDLEHEPQLVGGQPARVAGRDTTTPPTRLASAHSAAIVPTTIITMLRDTGARASSPSLGASGGRTRAMMLPTAIAAPRASTR